MGAHVDAGGLGCLRHCSVGWGLARELHAIVRESAFVSVCLGATNGTGTRDAEMLLGRASPQWRRKGGLGVIDEFDINTPPDLNGL